MPRDKERIQKRNKDLVERHKQLYDIDRKRHDDVINQLADEFYLDPDTVGRIISGSFRGDKQGKGA